MSVREAQANERRARIVAALRTNKMTKAQLCERFGVSARTMTQTLQALIRLGVIASYGGGSYVTYSVVQQGEACSPTS